MNQRSRLAMVVLAVAVFASAVVGVISLSTPAVAGPCICPKIYAPVICDNGKTYPNQCVADCRHARNCVPTGEI